MATTLTSTAHNPSRPPLTPPTAPLPALPLPKSRKPLPSSPYTSEPRRNSSTTLLPTPTARRSFTSSVPLPTKFRSTSSIPTVSTVHTPPPLPPAPPKTGKRLRKTISIGAFPQPPTGTPRVSSLPPSPLSTATSLSDLHAASRRDSANAHGVPPGTSGVRKRKPRSSGYGVQSVPSAQTFGRPSLVDGTGENRLVSGAAGARGSQDLPGLPSPPTSPPSSPQLPCTTAGAVSREIEEDAGTRGRHGSLDRPAPSKRDSEGNDVKGNVLVSVRVRPDVGGGDGGRVENEWMVDGRKSLVGYRGREGGDYYYDNVFTPHDSNARVYDHSAKRLVRRVMQGYHGTVFAYGTTGTGKTFSMQGTAHSPGVIPLAITDIFSYIRETPTREFLLRASYLEIYNERIYDLLAQSAAATADGVAPQPQQQEEIKLREDGKRGVYATPLKEEIVQSPNQLLRVISRGDQARRTASTQHNARSSRSHAVVQIVVESRERTPGLAPTKGSRRPAPILPGGVLVSTLSLIDLAGSERAAESKARRTEGAHINKSLLTLGTVVARLSGEKDRDAKPTTELDREGRHLPYRDSKLTRLLQPALSGDSLVSILCTVQLSPVGG
ncbi:hypothetical protein LTR28_005906, partial [Elasticomyces elasticus]